MLKRLCIVECMNRKEQMIQNGLRASDVRAGMTVRLGTGTTLKVASIVRETHPHPIVGEVLTFVSETGLRASFKEHGTAEVIA